MHRQQNLSHNPQKLWACGVIDIGRMAIRPKSITPQAHNFCGLCERFCCLGIIGKNTISHSFEKALFRAKDAPVFLRFQWEISLSVRKCWLSLRRARLRIFFKTSYILYKTAAKPNFSFVKSTNYLPNQQKYKTQQKTQRKITRFFKINFIFTAKSCN